MPHFHRPHATRQDARGKLKISFFLTLVLFAGELAGGFYSNSLALLSDAGHMLGDLVALTLSLLSIVWATKRAEGSKTYGYYRAEALATMVNGALLLYVGAQILLEGGRRMFSPETVDLAVMLPVAVLGMAVNLVCALLLRSHSGHLVTRSAFYHVVSDFFSSVCVILAGVFLLLTGWKWIDAAASLVIAVFIFRNAFVLLKEVYDVLMEASPVGLEPEAVRREILRVDGVRDLYDLHVWTISSGFVAASAHLVVRDMTIRESELVVRAVQTVMHDRFGIEHATFQLSCSEITVPSVPSASEIPGAP